jgi:hypothetical protein
MLRLLLSLEHVVERYADKAVSMPAPHASGTACTSMHASRRMKVQMRSGLLRGSVLHVSPSDGAAFDLPHLPEGELFVMLSGQI